MFLIGRKVGMSQIWNEEGKVIPVTVVQAGPVVVTQIKTEEKDGYQAFQVGYDPSKKKLSKPLKGHLKDLGNFRFLREFKPTQSEISYNVGDKIDVSVFNQGDKVKVIGYEKGRGFQGVVKRHGFHGGPKTHGQKNRLRAPGSLGPTAPQRVIKGRKMAGRMGNERVTIKSEVVGVDKENNLLLIKGPLPGNKKNILLIQKV
ncbi:MAG: 50S ribosomal protein L3 [Candidatus Parcubacteria bacterium]|nr:MAG: 50S ribosomal protein L3 [Candidatus Parcubacteria bacterium]